MATAKSHYYWRNEGGARYLYLYVHAVPRAKQDRVAGRYGERLKIQIAAPANDGKANARLVKLLAARFRVSQKAIAIVQGEAAPQKLVRVRVN